MTDNQLTISGLTCEYRSQPLGMDVPAPRLSWLLESPRRGARQTAFQVAAAEDETQLGAERVCCGTAASKSQTNRCTCHMQAPRCARASGCIGG